MLSLRPFQKHGPSRGKNRKRIMRNLEEQRAFPRIDVEVTPIELGTNEGPTFKGVAKNISAGGVCVIIDPSIAAGAHVNIGFDLPGQDSSVACSGEVVWCGDYLAASSQKHIIGIKFTDISENDCSRINRFVDSHVSSGEE